MNGADFLNLAVRLAAGPDEPAWRTATSRAYYAAFHVARDLLTGMGFAVPRADQAHQYLYHRLNNCGNPLLIRIASELNQLRRHRNEADYDLHHAYVQSSVTTDTTAARQIIQALTVAKVEPARTQVRDGIIAYERNVLRQTTWSPPPP